MWWVGCVVGVMGGWWCVVVRGGAWWVGGWCVVVVGALAAAAAAAVVWQVEAGARLTSASRPLAHDGHDRALLLLGVRIALRHHGRHRGARRSPATSDGRARAKGEGRPSEAGMRPGERTRRVEGRQDGGEEELELHHVDGGGVAVWEKVKLKLSTDNSTDM